MEKTNSDYYQKVKSFSNRVIPNLKMIDEFRQKFTKGELELILYFDSFLRKDSKKIDYKNLENYNGWLIFPQSRLNGSFPDIIIFRPNFGLYIYEVKDINLENYRYHSETKEFEVWTPQGYKKRKSPIAQAKHYERLVKYTLIPELGNKCNSNKRTNNMIKSFVYFSNHTKEEVEDFFKIENLNNSTNNMIFGKDALEKDLVFPFDKKTVDPIEEGDWDKQWNKELISWVYPPKHFIEQGRNITLNSPQKKLATPSQGHFRCKGVAGSGKSQALVFRAANLAKNNKRVLVLTFNITLFHYLKDLIKRVPVEFDFNQIDFIHFHGFCNNILNLYAIPNPSKNTKKGKENRKNIENLPNPLNKEDYYKNIYKKVFQALSENGDCQKYDLYDAILIDEGNDFYVEWYEMLKKFLSANNELVICFDLNQNIYKRDLSWVDARYKGNKEILKEFTKNKIIYLNKIFRNKSPLQFLSDLFAREFHLLDTKVKLEHPGVFFDGVIKWKNITNDNFPFLNYVKDAFNLLRTRGEHASDIAILVSNKEIGWQIVHDFQKNKIEVIPALDTLKDGNKRYKHSFYLGVPKLKVSTIHSFKGWELENIILLIDSNFKINHELVYVGLTRSKKNLIVINYKEDYFDFSKKLKQYKKLFRVE